MIKLTKKNSKKKISLAKKPKVTPFNVNVVIMVDASGSMSPWKKQTVDTINQQIAAIKIKGDTTEYVADSFATKQNATVEDLLKKLPGIQVDKNGKITAQGSEVKKILVDGEEFFSDDPKVVTKGLQANAVDKVQLFDKKSDQAEFTGIDDGEKTKTINLELKEDRKKGYFGKVDAGGGTGGYYQSQGMINKFRGKRQISAFGIMSNTDKAGLGWSDMDKFSGGNNYIYSDDGDMMYTIGSGDQDFAGWNGKYEGEGLPKTWTGGMHYADKWQKDKFHLSANYRYARQNVEIAGTSTTQYVLPDNKGFVQQADKNQFSSNDRNGFDVLFECKTDSLSSIKISADGSD
ncbi:MAG: TonB-dependent receptor, partial [Chitinophagia bacterium]|nr:TonB-dependent receptor [Chitinophagia bacterium]